MTDSLLSEIIRYVRSHTAFRAWLVEILVLFVLFTLGRAAIAVWLRWDTPTVQWWAKWLYAYDNLRAYSDDALVAAILLVIIFEGGFMFLARKRIALSRAEGHEEGHALGHQEGHQVGFQEGRAATEAELMPVIRDLQERLRKLEGRSGDANP